MKFFVMDDIPRLRRFRLYRRKADTRIVRSKITIGKTIPTALKKKKTNVLHVFLSITDSHTCRYQNLPSSRRIDLIGHQNIEPFFRAKKKNIRDNAQQKHLR